MTLAEVEFLRQALADIENVKSENELLDWDTDVSSDPLYLQIPENAIRQLEDAYRRKLAWLLGVGAG